jgi:cytochrome P450
MIALFGLNYLKIPFSSNTRFLKNKAKMEKMVKEVIEKRKKNDNQSKGKELLSLMMDAEDENGQKISDQGLIDESLTFLFAGHDTTSG